MVYTFDPITEKHFVEQLCFVKQYFFLIKSEVDFIDQIEKNVLNTHSLSFENIQELLILLEKLINQLKTKTEEAEDETPKDDFLYRNIVEKKESEQLISNSNKVMIYYTNMINFRKFLVAIVLKSKNVANGRFDERKWNEYHNY